MRLGLSLEAPSQILVPPDTGEQDFVSATRRYSHLEAFSRNLSHGSFAPLADRPSIWTKCLNLRFRSYSAGLLSQQHVTVGWKQPVPRLSISSSRFLFASEQSSAWRIWFAMIGRADIEGSKATSLWLQRASYPCNNFSDTSYCSRSHSHGSISHAFVAWKGSSRELLLYENFPSSQS